MKNTLKIFVDSDAFVALTVTTDANHKKAISLLHRLHERSVVFLTSNYVFSESITVISMRSSHAIAVAFIEKMQSLDNPFRIKQIDATEEEEAINIFKAQTSKNTNFVDCTNMVFMKWLSLDAIFSFDDVYRKNGFTLVENLLLAEEQAA
jgi:predicted nucleic acid-binding protein